MGLLHYRECERAVQFRGDRNHVGVASKELLEEPSYSVVSARVAAGTDQDYRRTSTSGRDGWPGPVRKGPYVSRNVCYTVRVERYRSIAIIAQRHSQTGRRVVGGS